MLIEGVNFPEIKTEYDYYQIKIGNRKIKLIYKIREYAIVSNKKANNFKKNEIKMKSYGHKRNDGSVITAFYKPYSVKIMSLKHKKKMVDTILNLMLTEDVKLIDHIEDKWYKSNAHKLTSTPLMDKEATTLDILSSYYMGGVEGEGILTQDMERTIEHKEITTVAQMMNSDEKSNYSEVEFTNPKPKWEIRYMNKKKNEKHLKYAPKRWKNSKTFKMGNIFSFDNHKNEIVNWDWRKNDFVGVNLDYHYKFDRLINPEKVYKSKWAIVNTDNVFEFEGQFFEINQLVKQYTTTGKNNKYEMEKILIIEQIQDDITKRYYFDENVDSVDRKLIRNI